ncbi:MAG TPA: hypothetical protein PLW09_07230 [Candidatus Kapabacteria bacterium]|nr:hypothetical protein [Candidatus Kapabacteria bacterium]
MKNQINAIKSFFFLSIIVSCSLIAQESKSQTSIGMNISQYQKDFGIGAHLISPYFFESIVAVKAGVNLQWLENIENNSTTWTPYQNFQLGLRSRHFVIENKLFIYSEGGAVLLLPNSKFSVEKTILGGYGIFGFEFKANQKISYFIELGGVGTGATAELVQNKPIYSNGFLTNIGLRIIP